MRWRLLVMRAPAREWSFHSRTKTVAPSGKIRLSRAATRSAMPEPYPRLHVLIANERESRLDTITEIVERLGHEIVARGVNVEQVGALSRREHADIALVGLGTDTTHALELISSIVKEAACPVIALLDGADPTYVTEAAKRGVFAYVIIDGDPSELQNALDITLRRFAEFSNLQGAFGRRAIIEQAKGILMARNAITADEAFALLKSQSQHNGQKLIDVAEAVTQTHQLLPPTAHREPASKPSHAAAVVSSRGDTATTT
jgi:two-component system, response regulator PdtaR